MRIEFYDIIRIDPHFVGDGLPECRNNHFTPESLPQQLEKRYEITISCHEDGLVEALGELLYGHGKGNVYLLGLVRWRRQYRPAYATYGLRIFTTRRAE